MALNLIFPPAVEPIALADAKTHLRVDPGVTEHDSLITMLIAAARRAAEHQLQRALITQTWELTVDKFPTNELQLGKHKVQSIVSVTYIDVNGLTQTMSSALYALDKEHAPGWLLPAYNTAWPATQDMINAVRVQFKAGYGDTGASVPENVIQWMLLQIGAMYENPSAVAQGLVFELPGRFTDALLDSEKVWA